MSVASNVTARGIAVLALNSVLPRSLLLYGSVIGGSGNRMLSAAYDILLKKNAEDVIWVEVAHDLESAKSRVEELAARSHGEYVIFDQRARKIVAQFSPR